MKLKCNFYNIINDGIYDSTIPCAINFPQVMSHWDMERIGIENQNAIMDDRLSKLERTPESQEQWCVFQNQIILRSKKNICRRKPFRKRFSN